MNVSIGDVKNKIKPKIKIANILKKAKLRSQYPSFHLDFKSNFLFKKEKMANTKIKKTQIPITPTKPNSTISKISPIFKTFKAN